MNIRDCYGGPQSNPFIGSMSRQSLGDSEFIKNIWSPIKNTADT